MKTLSKPEFQLHNAILLVALTAAYPVSAAAAGAAGIAQFAAGDVSLRRVDGKTDALIKGRDVGSGEAIVTGANGRVQVKFSDGGVVSLQPNTEFKVSNYVDQSDPKEDRFLVDLLRGSMRAITGLIGKRNRENYKVTTTTATIGIRGSGFNAGYNPDGTLGVTTEFDGIEVCNAAGCVSLTAGESVLVVNNTTLPARTNTRADVPTPQTKQDAIVAGNQVDSSGASLVVPHAPARLLTGVAFTGVGLSGKGYDLRSSVNGSLLLGDGSNAANSTQPSAYVSNSSTVGTGTSIGERSVIASSGSLQTGDYMVLGTWAGTSWVTPDGNTNTIGSTAFAAGVPSPDAAVFALGGRRASYALKNATPVFSALNGTGTLLPSSKINVDFSGVGSYADINLDINFPVQTGLPLAAGQGGTTLTSQASYNLRGGITSTGNGLSGVLAVSGALCQNGLAACGSGSVAGGFSGPNAQNALISFGAVSLSSGAFGGAATFSKGSAQVTPSSSSLTDLVLSFTDGSGIIPSGHFSTFEPFYTTKPTFYGEKLVSMEEDAQSFSRTTTTLRNSAPATGSFGALGVISSPDFLGWGNWVAGTKEFLDTTAYGGSTSLMLDSVHYIVGRPTPQAQMPLTGSFDYALVGGTTPTATLNGVSTQGRLLSANLTANFSTSYVDVKVATQFGAAAVNINERAYLYSANFSGSSVTGFFTGNQAARAGIVYQTNDLAVGRVTGAAAFQRSGVAPGVPTGPL